MGEIISIETLRLWHEQEKENIELQERIKKATELLETLIPICIMPNNTLIHGTEKAKVIGETLKILKGEK